MKVALCVLLAVFSCQTLADGSVSEKWQQFQRDFGKSYKSPVEARTRYAIFEKNLKNIEEHNVLYENGEVSWKKGINKFSDWTSEEFNQYVHKFKQNKNIKFPVAASRLGEVSDIPESIDWRTEGVVSPVEDQGECSGDYAFSATGAIEAQYKLIKNVTVSLSKQNLIDCANSLYDYPTSLGCSGGLMIDGFTYAEVEGVATEEDYPYEGKNGECRPKTNTYKVNGYVSIPRSEKVLGQFVATVGPVSILMASTENLQSYAGGVFYDEDCPKDDWWLNALIFGYGSDNGDDYWLIKNSWGSSWGEDGYLRISKKNNNCGVQDWAFYPLLTD